MYLKITQKCNMSCAHCGMNSNSKGKHMTREVWQKAIEFAKGYSEHITVGGGEPTLHPDFWEILGLCIGNFESVWMATNGSQTETSLALARLAKKGAIGVALSQDYYHSDIDPRVVAAFTKREHERDNENDAREIRNVSGKEIKAGRCKDGQEDCICSDLMIMEDGTIRGCGCKSAPKFGSIFAPSIPEDWIDGECSKDQERLKKEEAA